MVPDYAVIPVIQSRISPRETQENRNCTSAIQVQIVESDKWMPCRSWTAVCSRPKVHSSNGYPSERGFWRAQLISALRTASLWVGWRPGRGQSSNPASVAVSSGFSTIAAIIRARWTKRIGSFRDATRRLISASSSVVNARRRMLFGMISS